MNIEIKERTAANNLTKLFLAHKDNLPYVNLNEANQYKGWVADFGFRDASVDAFHLDLHKEENVFPLSSLLSE